MSPMLRFHGWVLRKGSAAALPLVVLGSLLSVANGQPAFDGASDSRRGEYSPTFDEVDFPAIEERARHRDLAVRGERLETLVRRNFSYVFWNCVDQKRFLAPPPPKRVAQSMLEVLDLNQRLTSLLVDARQLASVPKWVNGGPQVSDSQRLMRELREVAKDLKDAFRKSFVDMRRSRYQVAVPLPREPRPRFLAFVVQAERINRSLTEQVDDYFFNANPGAVKVKDFEEASVAVLAEALAKLCEMSAKSDGR